MWGRENVCLCVWECVCAYIRERDRVGERVCAFLSFSLFSLRTTYPRLFLFSLTFWLMSFSRISRYPNFYTREKMRSASYEIFQGKWRIVFRDNSAVNVMIILRVLLLMTLIIEIRMILIITTFFLLRNFIRRFLLLLIFTYFHVSLFQPIFVVTLFYLGVRVNKSLEILDLSYNQLGKYGQSTYIDSIKLVFYAALCTLILTPTPEPAPTP